MATVRIYYTGTVSNPDNLFLNCRYNQIGTNNTKQAIFGSDSWKTEGYEHTAMKLLFRSRDTFRGKQCFYADVQNDDEKKVNRFIEWAKGHPAISVPDFDNNELNEVIKSKSLQPMYVLVNMDEQVQRGVAFNELITKARGFVLDLFYDDRMKLWDVSWFTGFNPLGKTVDEVFLHLNGIANSNPSVIYNYNTLTESELVDLAIRKASYLQKPSGTNVMVTHDGRVYRMYDTSTSYSTIEGLREDLIKNRERLTDLMRNVDKASKLAFGWSENPNRKASDVKSIGTPDTKTKEKLTRLASTENDKRPLSDYEAEMHRIMDDDLLVIDQKQKLMTKQYGMMKEHYSKNECEDAIDSVTSKYNKTITNFNEWFEGGKKAKQTKQ